jgi:hypothetical protein
MKPACREDDNPWASLGQRTRAEGLDLDTTSLPQAIDWLLDRLANEADCACQKTLASLASLLIQIEAACVGRICRIKALESLINNLMALMVRYIRSMRRRRVVMSMAFRVRFLAGI